MTSEELKDIFYTGYTSGPNWQILDDLYVAIIQGHMLHESKRIATIAQY